MIFTLSLRAISDVELKFPAVKVFDEGLYLSAVSLLGR